MNEVTLGKLGEAEEAVERVEPGAWEARERLCRDAGYASYADLQRTMSEMLRPIGSAIKKAIGEPEIEAVLARKRLAEADPIWRAMLRAGHLGQVRLGDLVREVRIELRSAPAIVPEGDVFENDAAEYKRAKARQARALLKSNVKWAAIEIEVDAGVSRRTLQRWVKNYSE